MKIDIDMDKFQPKNGGGISDKIPILEELSEAGIFKPIMVWGNQKMYIVKGESRDAETVVGLFFWQGLNKLAGWEGTNYSQKYPKCLGTIFRHMTEEQKDLFLSHPLFPELQEYFSSQG